MALFVPKKASQLKFTPVTGITATQTQAAIVEVDSKIITVSAVPGLVYEVIGDSSDGGATPNTTTQSYIDTLVSLGVPLANIIWFYAAAGASITLPASSYAISYNTIGIAAFRDGTFSIPANSIAQSYAVPSIYAAIAGVGLIEMVAFNQPIAYSVMGISVAQGATSGTISMASVSQASSYSVPGIEAAISGDGFESDANGWTGSHTSIARSTSDALVGSYSFRYNEQHNTANLIRYMYKTISLTNNQTISFKHRGQWTGQGGDANGDISIDCLIDGIAQFAPMSFSASQTTWDLTRTKSWTYTGTTGSYEMRIRAQCTPETYEGDFSATDFWMVIDEIVY